MKEPRNYSCTLGASSVALTQLSAFVSSSLDWTLPRDLLRTTNLAVEISVSESSLVMLDVVCVLFCWCEFDVALMEVIGVCNYAAALVLLKF